jgi:5-methyltetrahydrofolate--homocysteine methyltransferase
MAAIRAVKENTSFNFSHDYIRQKRPDITAVIRRALPSRRSGWACGDRTLNSSLAPSEIYPIAEKIAGSTGLPLIVKPNAGLPNSVTGAYDIGPEEFARQMASFAALGVKIVGGCCGTSPEYIRELKRVYQTLKPSQDRRDTSLRICSSLRIEIIDGLSPDDMKIGNVEPQRIVNDALEQSDGGKAVVTVPLPASLAAEEAAHITHSIQPQSDCPLILLSNDIVVLSAALHEVPVRRP